MMPAARAFPSKRVPCTGSEFSQIGKFPWKQACGDEGGDVEGLPCTGSQFSQIDQFPRKQACGDEGEDVEGLSLQK